MLTRNHEVWIMLPTCYRSASLPKVLAGRFEPLNPHYKSGSSESLRRTVVSRVTFSWCFCIPPRLLRQERRVSSAGWLTPGLQKEGAV